MVEEFESALAAGQGVEHAVAVSTGTAAVHLALHALDVGPGDEVIVPAHTFIGSASPVTYLGARPVFADVTPDTHCLDSDSVKSLLTERTKAIVAVHINGCAADMKALSAVGTAAGVPVIEDMAQALGTGIDGRPVGGFGDLACVSLFEQKVITSGGEGGAVLTNNPAYAERMRRLRSHGEGPIEGRPGLIWAHEVGYNYRLTSVQAAVGLSQHARLGAMVEARRRSAAQLSERLAGTDGLELPVEPEGTVHAFWKYVVRVVPGDGRPCGCGDRGDAALPRHPGAAALPVPAAQAACLRRAPRGVAAGRGAAVAGAAGAAVAPGPGGEAPRPRRGRGTPGRLRVIRGAVAP